MSGAQHDINSSMANILIFWALYGGPVGSSLSHPQAAGLIRSLCTEQWPHRMMSSRWVRGVCAGGGGRFGVYTFMCMCLKAVSFVGSCTSDDAGSHQTFIDYYQNNKGPTWIHCASVCCLFLSYQPEVHVFGELRGTGETCRWMLMLHLPQEYKDSAVKAFMWQLMLDLQLVAAA